MSRSVGWRRVISDAASWRQDQALNATMYILRQTGPTGFLLKEEGESKKFKVFLGDPHRCNCSVFRKEKDVCKHICWLLLKKFKLPRHDPVSWQLGLVEREINEVLHGQLAAGSTRHGHSRTAPQKHLAKAADGRNTLEQKAITEDDVCPICQEELLEKKLPVTYCKFGCGNSIHIKCMKVWAEHQKSQGEKTIKCPLCREDFGSFDLLRQEGRNADQSNASRDQLDRHIWAKCRSCLTCPIIGKCYRCTSCTDFHLCQSCFNTPVHTDHSFQYRQKRNERWRPAQRVLGMSLPQAVVTDLLNRDLSDADYDLLLQLDSQQNAGNQSVPCEAVELFPLERVREGSQLLAPGVQCRMCLRGYSQAEFVRKLPCRHKFHRDCIDPWLLHSHVTCPVDGQVVWTPNQNAENHRPHPERNRESSGDTNPSIVNNGNHSNMEVEVPGVGLSRGRNSVGSIAGLSPGIRHRDSEPSSDRQRPTIPNYRDGEIPFGLNSLISGTSLSGHSSSGEITNESDDRLLGTRLLARARLRRKKIGEQLSTLHCDRIPVEPVAPSIPLSRELIGQPSEITLGHQMIGLNTRGLQGRPPRVQTTPETGTSTCRRGRARHRTNSLPLPEHQTGRQRSSSRERFSPHQVLGDLYLGNSPEGSTINTDTAVTNHNARRHKLRPSQNRSQHPKSPLNHGGLLLEGNAVNQLS